MSDARPLPRFDALAGEVLARMPHLPADVRRALRRIRSRLAHAPANSVRRRRVSGPRRLGWCPDTPGFERSAPPGGRPVTRHGIRLPDGRSFQRRRDLAAVLWQWEA